MPSNIESNLSGGLKIDWKECWNPAEVSWLVAINPNYARYSHNAGLEIGQPSPNLGPIRYTNPPPLQHYSYEREAFVTHARRVVEQAKKVMAACPSMLHKLREHYPNAAIGTLVELICCLHDTGKLQVEWQEQAMKWQTYCDERDGKVHSAEALAHTSYDPSHDRGNPQLPQFPPHATCGAFAVLPYLFQHFTDEIALVMCTAIARHHGTHTRDLNRFELMPEAGAVLRTSLPEGAPLPFSCQLTANRTDTERFPDDYLLRFQNNESIWPLYAGLVRILRLADQGSLGVDHE